MPRFLFSSSCSLYGAAGDAPVTEDSAFNPVTPYGESKVMAEQLLARLADESFSPVYLRNATAYGSSPRLRADIVVNNLTGTAFTRGEVHLQSDGSPWRPLVHVRDISACLPGGPRGRPRGCPRPGVQRGTRRGRRADPRHRHRGGRAHGAPVTFAEGASPDKRDYRVDFAKIARLLPAFRPQWTLPAGIDELANDMEQFGLLPEDFEGDRFVRLQRVNDLRSVAGGSTTCSARVS